MRVDREKNKGGGQISGRGEGGMEKEVMKLEL